MLLRIQHLPQEPRNAICRGVAFCAASPLIGELPRMGQSCIPKTQAQVNVMALGLVQMLDNTLAGSRAMPTTCRPL